MELVKRAKSRDANLQRTSGLKDYQTALPVPCDQVSKLPANFQHKDAQANQVIHLQEEPRVAFEDQKVRKKDWSTPKVYKRLAYLNNRSQKPFLKPVSHNPHLTNI